MNKYNQNLDKNPSNYVPLTPLSFLERAKDIYPNYEALVYEAKSFTWSEVFNRCIKFASALEKIGIVEGAVSYTHLRAHETVLDLVCRLLLEKKKKHYRCQ